jgi:hypothetical protein
MKTTEDKEQEEETTEPHIQPLGEFMDQRNKERWPACIEPMPAIGGATPGVRIQVGPGVTLGVVDPHAAQITYISYMPPDVGARCIIPEPAPPKSGHEWWATRTIPASMLQAAWLCTTLVQFWIVHGQADILGHTHVFLFILTGTLCPQLPLILHWAARTDCWPALPSQVVCLAYLIAIKTGIACLLANNPQATSTLCGTYWIMSLVMCFLALMDLMLFRY